MPPGPMGGGRTPPYGAIGRGCSGEPGVLYMSPGDAYPHCCCWANSGPPGLLPAWPPPYGEYAGLPPLSWYSNMGGGSISSNEYDRLDAFLARYDGGGDVGGYELACWFLYRTRSHSVSLCMSKITKQESHRIISLPFGPCFLVRARGSSVGRIERCCVVVHARKAYSTLSRRKIRQSRTRSSLIRRSRCHH